MCFHSTCREKLSIKEDKKMQRKIRLIGEFGNTDQKALLLEMPQDMIQGLKIYADGTIDSKCLLGMLMMMEQEAALEADKNSVSIPEQLDLVLNIYDAERAINFENKAIN
jgi:hypothetical protein